MRKFFLSLACFTLSVIIVPTASGQRRDAYGAYKTLLNSFLSVRLQGNYYIITSDSGTGIADTLGHVLLPPRYQLTQASLTGLAGYHTWYELKSPKEAMVADLQLNILQQGPYNRYWLLDDKQDLFYVFTNDGKGGVRTRNGRWMVPPIYDAVYNFEGFRWPLVLLSKGGRFGAVDTATGREIIPFRFDYFTYQQPYIIAHLPDSSLIYNAHGRLVAALPYHDISYLKGIFTAGLHGTWALLDSVTWKPLTPFVYEEFKSLGTANYMAFKRLGEEFEGVMDRKGKIVLDARYDYIQPLDGNSFEVQSEDNAALYDANFHLLIRPRKGQSFTTISSRTDVRPVSDWVSVMQPKASVIPWVEHDEIETSFLYNTRLKRAFPYTLASNRYASEGVYFGGALMEVQQVSGYKKVGRPLLMRRDGSIIPIEYSSTMPIGNNALAVTTAGGLMGIIDSSGHWLFKPVWADIKAVNDKVFALSAATSKDTLIYRLMYADGKPVDNIAYGAVPQPYGHSYWVQSHGKYGIADSAFHTVIPMRYDDMPRPVYDGRYYSNDSSLLIIAENGKHGVISSDGRTVLPAIYDQISPWMNVFLLLKGQLNAVADHRGHITTPFVRRQDLRVLNHFGDAAYRLNGRWGVINHLGDTLHPFVYDSVFEIALQPYMVLKKGSEYTVINAGGEEIARNLPCSPTRIAAYLDAIYCDTTASFQKAGNRWVRNKGDKKFVGTTQSIFINNELFAGRNHTDKETRSGVYNRAYRRIADYPHALYSVGFRTLQTGHLLLYPDSAGRHFAVLDTSGRYILPFIAVDSFWLLPQAAIAADTHTHRYIIYHFNGSGRTDTATHFFSDRDNIFRDGRSGARFMALPTWSPGNGLIAWGGAKGTGLLNIGTGQDTFLQAMYVKPWLNDYLLAWPEGSDYWGVLSGDARNWIIKPELDTIFYAGQTFRFRKGGKAGLMSVKDLHLIIPPVWDSIFVDGGGNNRETTYWVVKRGNKYSIVVPGGHVVTDGWDDIDKWSTRLFLRARRGAEEYTLYPGSDGHILSMPRTSAPAWDGYGTQYVHQFRKGGKAGVYSKVERRIIVPALFDNIEDKGDFFVCKINSGANKGIRVYNKQGKVKFTLPEDARPEFSYEMQFWEVADYPKASALDTNGAVLVPGGYDRIQRLNRDLFIVYRDDKYGIMAIGGRLVEPMIWDYMEALETAPMASKGDNRCLLQVEGKTVKTHCYDDLVQQGYDKEAAVFTWYAKKGKKWGRVDQNGNVLAPFKFDTYEDAVKDYNSNSLKWR